MTTITETLEDRIARLAIDREVSETRMESLKLAHPLVDDDTFRALASATRLSRADTILLPAHRFEHLSRGRGWCRKGYGDFATWGQRTPDGYRVGPGRWVVGATDGFSRKRQVAWEVRHIAVGDQTWCIAD